MKKDLSLNKKERARHKVPVTEGFSRGRVCSYPDSDLIHLELETDHIDAQFAFSVRGALDLSALLEKVATLVAERIDRKTEEE